jgi:Cu/Ag efflux protein CusF
MVFRLLGLLSLASSYFLVSTFPSIASKHTLKPTSSGTLPSVETHHPQGWRFTMPKGDPVKGKAVFEKFECYYCHEVRGEQFPPPTEDAPEFGQMGGLHPIEFFAESIINPNAYVAKAYRGSDGKSPMTDFTDKMTLRELIDVSTYVASLRPKGVAKTVSAQGQVVTLVPEKGEIVLTHGEIKGFMEAMTMGYKVSLPSLLKAVKPGDNVQFTIDTDKRVITRIVKAPPTRRKQ